MTPLLECRAFHKFIAVTKAQSTGKLSGDNVLMEPPSSPSSATRRKFRWKRSDREEAAAFSDGSVGSAGSGRQKFRFRSRSPGNFRRRLSSTRARDDSDIRLRTRSPMAIRFRRGLGDDTDVSSRCSNGDSSQKKRFLKKINPFSQRKAGNGNRKGDPDDVEFHGDANDSDWGGSNHTPVDSIGRRSRHRNRILSDDDVCMISHARSDRPDSIEVERQVPQRNVSFEEPVHEAEDLGYETMSGFTDDLTSDSVVPELTRATYSKPATQQKKHRVRPHHCFDPPLYMTEEEIYTDSIEPTLDFEHVQSYLAPSEKAMKQAKVPEHVAALYGSPSKDGRIGALRVEVLGCVSLNRSKPDVAAYLVCGDAAFTTDVVHGYRSPMWPSASKRAAIFPIHHAFARLYVGVFDVKARKNKENDVFCGRVAIDVCSLRPESEYDTTMPLRASTFVYDRKKRGVVRLRFSLFWFSERAAALSYFKLPKSLVESCPLVGGSPVIPCAEPKTFRNVAVAVHGQDLPGKYSRGAFRATMREFNLYQTNLRYMLKTLVLDAILYENPLVSLYLFLAGMHSVTVSSMRWVPPYIVGYIIIQLYRNYQYYVESEMHNCGYQPLTIPEVFKAVLKDGDQHESTFESISVAKKAKHRNNSGKGNQKLHRLDSVGEEEEQEAAPVDHHEFPFSDRDAYPKFGVEHALAPSTRKGAKRGSNTRLHGRLSVYYTSTPPSGADGAQDDESSEGEPSEGDDETMMTESAIDDSLFPLDMEGDEDDEMMDEHVIFTTSPSNQNAPSSVFDQGTASRTRRLKIGPIQNADTSSNSKVPPQIHLKKMENILHKFTKKISVEVVMAPETVVNRETRRRASLALNTEDLQAQARAKKKATYDEFDKLLGMETRSANPVFRIMSAFLGPLMRMIRIFIYIVRSSYNVVSWRDPYLTFWLFTFMCTLCFILIIFPWRTFFSLATMVCLGPQNIFVRIHLEKKAARKGTAEPVESQATVEQDARSRSASVDHSTHSRDSGINSSMHSTFSNDGGTRGGRRKNKLFRKKDRRTGPNEGSEDIMRTARPAFTTVATANARRYQSRSVAIPYSRLMKERFYDWPPDPTVSRATPINLAGKTKERKRRANLLRSSSPTGTDLTGEDDGAPMAGLRKRRTRHASIGEGRVDRRSSFDRLSVFSDDY